MNGLTPDEDEELRRLAALAEYGALTPDKAALYAELRARDRRTDVRPPRVLAVLVPRPREDANGSVSATSPWE